jgi:thiamine monophosphate synthase
LSGAHHCRLFVRLPAGARFEEALSAALKDPEAASFLLPAELPNEPARSAVQRIQAADRPALVLDDLERRSALQADGVHLTDATRVRAVRAKLGGGVVLGAACPLERHACMVAAEDGADYIAVRVMAETFAQGEELLAWWHEMMTTPIVALADEPIALARLRAIADFVSPPVRQQ